MKLRCKLGMHRYRPAIAFHSLCSDGYYYSNFEGYQCTACGTRKLKRLKGYLYHRPTPGERQDAYDWLNDVPSRTISRTIRLVK